MRVSLISNELNTLRATIHNYMTEHITLFPTTVLKQTRQVSSTEKDIWFDLFLKHSNANGESSDYIGFEQLHLEESVSDFYNNTLTQAVNEYLKMLSVSTSMNLNIYLTKSWFNVTNRAGINNHNHAEHHISFVYYPHVPQGNDAGFVLLHGGKHPNEPYDGFLAVNTFDQNQFNATQCNLNVSEGTLYLFPSDLYHHIDADYQPIQGFHNKQDLNNSRVCVAGDILLTAQHSTYQRALPPLENWQKLNGNI